MDLQNNMRIKKSPAETTSSQNTTHKRNFLSILIFPISFGQWLYGSMIFFFLYMVC